MKYREGGYYRFGLRAGLWSFVQNGFKPGFRIAASAVLQPINSYTRFPEYYFIEREVAALAGGRSADRPPLRVLDIGSPKLFGFILARRYDIDLTLSDIYPQNLEPYIPMWSPLRRGALGRARFEVRDARRLSDPDGSYDFVYAMSVLEHIEGPAGAFTEPCQRRAFPDHRPPPRLRPKGLSRPSGRSAGKPDDRVLPTQRLFFRRRLI